MADNKNKAKWQELPELLKDVLYLVGLCEAMRFSVQRARIYARKHTHTQSHRHWHQTALAIHLKKNLWSGQGNRQTHICCLLPFDPYTYLHTSHCTNLSHLTIFNTGHVCLGQESRRWHTINIYSGNIIWISWARFDKTHLWICGRAQKPVVHSMVHKCNFQNAHFSFVEWSARNSDSLKLVFQTSQSLYIYTVSLCIWYVRSIYSYMHAYMVECSLNLST